MKLIGGEMTGWTDGSPVRGPLLEDLLRQLGVRGRVLVAGPHDRGLLDVLTGARVTCLVRSVPDAEALVDAGVDVLCGTLAKLTDTDLYDLVIALDGLDRLCSVEGPQLDWAESLHVLRRAVKPGGALLLSVENELGVHRLVARSSARADSAWSPLGELDPAKPGNPARLASRLAGDGWSVSWLGAAWPVPSAPAVLATTEALTSASGALVAQVSTAVAAGLADQPVLSDPRRLAATAVRAGLGAELAASWLVLAHRGAAVPPAFEAIRAPAGRPVEELLLTACLRHDLPAVRGLLRSWVAWVHGSPAAATLDEVLLDGDTFAVLRPAVTDDPDVVVARALRRFAGLLLTGGYAHPWPITHDVDTLFTILAGAAGLDPVPDVPPAPDDTAVHIGVREQEDLDRRLRQQLADATARAEFYESELDRRDRELRKARTQIALFSGSPGFRAAKAGMAVARSGRRIAQNLRRKL